MPHVNVAEMPNVNVAEMLLGLQSITPKCCRDAAEHGTLALIGSSDTASKQQVSY